MSPSLMKIKNKFEQVDFSLPDKELFKQIKSLENSLSIILLSRFKKLLVPYCDLLAGSEHQPLKEYAKATLATYGGITQCDIVSAIDRSGYVLAKHYDSDMYHVITKIDDKFKQQSWSIEFGCSSDMVRSTIEEICEEHSFCGYHILEESEHEQLEEKFIASQSHYIKLSDSFYCPINEYELSIKNKAYEFNE